MKEEFTICGIAKVLEDPTRIRALALMLKVGELTLTDFQKVTDLIYPSINRHFKYMAHYEVLSFRKIQQNVLTDIHKDYKKLFETIFTETGVFNDQTVKDDIRRFRILEDKGDVRDYLHEGKD